MSRAEYNQHPRWHELRPGRRDRRRTRRPHLGQPRAVGVYYTVYRWAGEGLPGAFGQVYFRNNAVDAKAQYGLG